MALKTVFFKRVLQCFILCCVCYFPDYVKGADLYLKVNNKSFTSSDKGPPLSLDVNEMPIYEIREEQHVHFVCGSEYGTEARLAINEGKKDKHDTQFKTQKFVNLDIDLTADSYDEDTVECTTHKKGDPNSYKSLAIRLVYISKNKPVNIWLIVLGVVVFLLVAAVAVWIWAGFKNRRKQGSSNIVTFADRNSVENLDPRAQDKKEEPTNVSVQKEPTTTTMRNSDANRISVQDINSIKNALRKSDKINPKRVTDEITYASLQFKERSIDQPDGVTRASVYFEEERSGTPVKKTEPTYASIQRLEGRPLV